MMKQQQNAATHWAVKLLRAIIVGVSCFFVGVLLAILSPIIALISLLHKPQPRSTRLAEKWEKGVKRFEEKLREAQDPDYKESWKQEHLDLYGNNEVEQSGDNGSL